MMFIIKMHFSPSKVPEFLYVLFNLVVKCCPVFFWAKMLLFCSVALILHTIFCPRFS